MKWLSGSLENIDAAAKAYRCYYSIPTKEERMGGPALPFLSLFPFHYLPLLRLLGSHEHHQSPTIHHHFLLTRALPPDNDYLVDHSIFFYLVNREGDFLEFFGFSFHPSPSDPLFTHAQTHPHTSRHKHTRRLFAAHTRSTGKNLTAEEVSRKMVKALKKDMAKAK